MSQLKKTRSRIHLFSGAVIMLVLALGFNILLTSATFEKLYVEIFISKNNVVAKDLQRNLETALRFGKRIDKFIGMDKLILEARQHLAPAQKKQVNPALMRMILLFPLPIPMDTSFTAAVHRLWVQTCLKRPVCGRPRVRSPLWKATL